jgi:phosphatidylserine synthase
MSENPTNNNANGQPTDYWQEREHWRQQRRELREQRHAWRHHGSGAWIGGAILILLGLVFLLQNTGIFFLNNWWALFILIPAFGSFASAYEMYQSNGHRYTHSVRWTFIAGVFFTLLAASFMFNVAAGLFLPLVLIMVGIALLVNFVTPQ